MSVYFQVLCSMFTFCIWQSSINPAAAASFCDVQGSSIDANNPLTWPVNNASAAEPSPLGAAQLTTQGGSTAAQQVANYLVRKHNCLRSRVSPMASNMLEMVWNNEAAQQAQHWADNCVYAHNPISDRTTSQFACGQNIAMSWPTPLSWNSVVNMWYNEVNQYVYGGSNSNVEVGHYTQIVWAKTFQLGCGYQYCTPQGQSAFHFYVCNYCPAGNLVDSNGVVQVPYATGSTCAACPSDCDNGELCGPSSACAYSNVYSNCDDLRNQYNACGSSLASSCQASCLCQGKIY